MYDRVVKKAKTERVDDSFKIVALTVICSNNELIVTNLCLLWCILFSTVHIYSWTLCSPEDRKSSDKNVRIYLRYSTAKTDVLSV